MALNWKLEKIENWQELKDDAHWGMTQGMIWATLIVGIGQLTKETAPVFFGRLKLIEKLDGCLFNDKDEPHEITRAEVDRYIGLSTNASYTVEPEAKWLKRQLKGYTLGMPKKIRKVVAK